MMGQFNFIEAYKELQPTADRGVIEWRNASFAEIVKSINWKQIVDLTRLAFNLPYDAKDYEDWFQKAMHDSDAYFFVTQDAAEAGRVATLILRHFLSSGNETACSTALLALAASFAGKPQAREAIGPRQRRAREPIAGSRYRRGEKGCDDGTVRRGGPR
jgi:hypothetical protein